MQARPIGRRPHGCCKSKRNFKHAARQTQVKYGAIQINKPLKKMIRRLPSNREPTRQV